jgi:hypothetical protein
MKNTTALNPQDYPQNPQNNWTEKDFFVSKRTLLNATSGRLQHQRKACQRRVG